MTLTWAAASGRVARAIGPCRFWLLDVKREQTKFSPVPRSILIADCSMHASPIARYAILDLQHHVGALKCSFPVLPARPDEEFIGFGLRLFASYSRANS